MLVRPTPDYRLYSGRKGAMARLQLEDSVLDRMGATFVGADGWLDFSRVEEGRRLKAEWVSGSARTPAYARLSSVPVGVVVPRNAPRASYRRICL